MGDQRSLRSRALDSYLAVPTVLLLVLLIANIILQPSLVSESNWASTLSVTCPYILTAMAMAMPVLSGNGGLDLSVGPFTRVHHRPRRAGSTLGTAWARRRS